MDEWLACARMHRGNRGLEVLTSTRLRRGCYKIGIMRNMRFCPYPNFFRVDWNPWLPASLGIQNQRSNVGMYYSVQSRGVDQMRHQVFFCHGFCNSRNRRVDSYKYLVVCPDSYIADGAERGAKVEARVLETAVQLLGFHFACACLSRARQTEVAIGPDQLVFQSTAWRRAFQCVFGLDETSTVFSPLAVLEGTHLELRPG